MVIFGKTSEYPKLFSTRPSELAVYHQYKYISRSYFDSKLTGWPVDTRIKHQEVASHLPAQELVVKSIAVCYDAETGIQQKNDNSNCRSCDSSAIESICSLSDVIPIALSTQWLSCPMEPMESWESAWRKEAASACLNVLKFWRPTETSPRMTQSISRLVLSLGISTNCYYTQKSFL